ncbi:MAG TPA: hypothetical protein VFO34_02800 [Candidatus Acidoferrales bacterium]|nr:hypothetical protein [Candidatus Acidoferrales bacterium]
MSDGHETIVNEGTPRWLGLAVAALGIISLAGLGVGWSAVNHARDAQQAASSDNKIVRQNLDDVTKRLAQEEALNQQLQGDLNAVEDHMKLSQGELDKARSAIRKDYSKRLADMQASMQTELAGKASTDDVTGVKTDVAGIHTDVNGVRTDLDSAKSSLLAGQNELGTQIARTHDEVDQLRRLGQRDYFEFTVANKGGKQKFGDVTLELRGTNVKHNQYTVNLYVDDMRLEKKNRAVNEPIFFYTRGSRSAMELVVNQVGKDKIVGYLSVSKSAGMQAQAASATPGSN